MLINTTCKRTSAWRLGMGHELAGAKRLEHSRSWMGRPLCSLSSYGAAG